MSVINGANYVTFDGRTSSYCTVIPGVAVTANGVLLQIQGSATRIIRVKRIFATGVLTTAAQVLVQAFRTTAAASSVAGNVTVTASKLNSAIAAASSVSTSYTSATLGTGSVLLGTGRGLYSPATAYSNPVEMIFGARTQSLELRGTSEFLHVTVAASAFTGALFDVDVEFTEERPVNN